MLVNGRQVSNYTAPAPGDRVQVVHGGGIEWTIKDGIPYHVPTLMREVREMVGRKRASANRTTAPLMAANHVHSTAAPGLGPRRSSSPRRRRRVMRAFFDADALGAWWQVDAIGHDAARARPLRRRVAADRYRDEVLGRLGGVFRGTVMQFEAGRGFFVADAFWLPPDGEPIGPMALEVTCAATDDGHRRSRACRPASRKACGGGATTRSSPLDGSARSDR